MILCVDVVAELQLRNRKGIARIVEHQNFTRVGTVPEDFPAGDVLCVDVARIIDDTDAAPGIGNGVEVFRIIGEIPEGLVYVLEVRNVLKIQRFQHILGDELFDHIVRGNDNVIGRAAGFELGVHTLVAVEGHVVDLDVGIGLFKLRNDVNAAVGAVGNILPPVVDIDRDLLFRSRGGQAQCSCKQADGEQKRKQLFHPARLLFRWECWRLLLSRACRRFITDIMMRITTNISVKSA